MDSHHVSITPTSVRCNATAGVLPGDDDGKDQIDKGCLGNRGTCPLAWLTTPPLVQPIRLVQETNSRLISSWRPVEELSISPTMPTATTLHRQTLLPCPHAKTRSRQHGNRKTHRERDHERARRANTTEKRACKSLRYLPRPSLWS
jgi:hypothetical protein